MTDHLSQHEQRRVCVEAPCDPRTLRKYLRGLPVRPMATVAIERALRRLGHLTLLRPADGENHAQPRLT